MTLLETRQLGIEFERRVQTMIPETEFINKLDTDTIYSFLNQCQDKLILELYRTVDQINPSNNQTYIETLLSSMVKTENKIITGSNSVHKISLPEDFGLYISSCTNVDSSYRYKTLDNTSGSIPNKIITIKEAVQLTSSPQDSMRIIRTPFVWLSGDDIYAMYDKHTTPTSIDLTYYRLPRYMNLMTSTNCELPVEMFEQLVSGAVDLYVQYVAGAEARKRLMQLSLQQNKRNNEDEE